MAKRIISLVLFQLMIFAALSGVFSANALYENTYTNTGKGQSDIVEIAKTQIGYVEGCEQYTGYTKYGAWYNTNYAHDNAFITAPWCAMFVSWCSGQAGTLSVTGSYAYCPYWVQHFKDIGKWQSRSSGYIPVSGDIIFFSDDGVESGVSSHVGIVYESNRSTVYTIEGNTADSCAYRSYSITDTYIIGYGTPAYNGRVQTEVPEIPTPVVGERVYITGYNQQMTYGAAIIFDKNFNGTNTATYSELGIAWSSYLVLAPTTTVGEYSITQKGEHLQTGSLTIPENGLIFASHCDDRDTSSQAYINSSRNKGATNGFSVGDILFISGVNFTSGAVGATAILQNTEYVEDGLALIANSNYTIDRDKGFLLGVEAGVSLDAVKAQFTNNGVSFDKTAIGTGCKVTISDGNGGIADSLTIVVLGDLSGDGKVNALDYLSVKRAFLGTMTLTDAQLCAGCLSGGTRITATDYLKIKRHFLGTFNIYANS